MGCLQKLLDTICVKKGEKTRIFVHTNYLFGPKNFWGPKQCKPGKNYKNSGFSGNCPKPKMTPFFGKRCFWHGWKSGFYSLCFRKAVCFFSENTIFIVFSEKHSSCNTNIVCKQNTENWWKLVGCCWTRQKGVKVFFVCFFFRALMSLCFLSGKVARVLKMLIFPQFWGFVGWLLLVHLGLEGFFLCFLFLLFFLVLVLFLFVCFVLWLKNVVSSVFVFLFVFFLFVLFVFLEGLRVRWGGPKGHLTWP